MVNWNDRVRATGIHLVSRKLFWTALLDQGSLAIVGFAPLDPY